VGNAQSNVELATTRARVARDYLIARGVRADRMFLNVAGEAQPAVDNQDFYGNDLPKNRRWNRRVVLAILHEGGEIEPENR
jgi:outer membrane protein OmpA-like peptidoglycan-associated protein